MAFIDYYKILGVDKNIPQNKVRAAYLKRTKQFHPDLHPDDPKAKAKFQALNEAYDVISDPEKRKKYDQYGEKWREADAFQGGAGGFGGGGAGNPFGGFDFSQFSGSGGGGFSSFFQDLFGGRSQGRTMHWGSAAPRPDEGQVSSTVNIDLYTALLGGDIIIRLPSGSKLRLKLKPVTQNGTKVRLRGKGNRRSDGTMGDLIITYNIKLPDHLTPEQENLVRQMQAQG